MLRADQNISSYNNFLAESKENHTIKYNLENDIKNQNNFNIKKLTANGSTNNIYSSNSKFKKVNFN
jgi:hypothetical protein